ncbi:hypothetical protein Hanom_Chr03g00181171 [Helianthus anomalus]
MACPFLSFHILHFAHGLFLVIQLFFDTKSCSFYIITLTLLIMNKNTPLKQCFFV